VSQFFVEGSGGGGVGDVTSLTPDTGGTVNPTLGNINVFGQKAGTVPVMETRNTAGNFIVENRAWQTQYVVDTSTTPGTEGTFSTVQAAINQAVSDGATFGVYKTIYLRTGTYIENLTIPGGIMLVGEVIPLPESGITTPYQSTLIQGNHTFTGLAVGSFDGINFISSSGDMFSGGTDVLWYSRNCLFVQTSNNIFNNTSVSSTVLAFDSCTFGSAGQTIFTLQNAELKMIDCYFPQGGPINQTTSDLNLIDCYNIDSIISNGGDLELFNCSFVTSTATYHLSGNAAGTIHQCWFQGSAIAIQSTMSVKIFDCQVSSGFYFFTSYVYQQELDPCGNLMQGVTATISSSPYTVPNDALFNGINNTISSGSVLLDGGYNVGQILIIKDITGNASSNNIVISDSGGATIDGASTYTISKNYESVAIRFDGTNYQIIYGYNETSSGGSGITTIDGDSGSISGSTVTIEASNAGESVAFNNSGTNSRLVLTDANFNTFLGEFCGAPGVMGMLNTGVGTGSLGLNVLTSENTAIGYGALGNYVGETGGSNTAVGSNALNAPMTGANNIGIGNFCGLNWVGPESSNILIGSPGVASESNTIRIGDQGSGDGEQNTCYIAGIVGVTVSNQEFVTINSATGQLGVAASAGSGITTIDGDSGSITGSTVTIYANQASLGCGQSVLFTNSGTTSTLKVTDSNNSTLLGSGAGKSAGSGANNCAFGHLALSSMTSADSNMAFGSSALASCTQGQYNVAVGVIALQNLTTTSQNTGVGRNALGAIVTGSNNIGIGYNSGANCTTNDSNNIYIGNTGTAGDNNKISIGQSGTQTTCFVQGISGVTVTGTAVLCSTSGQLGTVVSSVRYKENIEPVGDDVSVLHLRPVSFNYRNDKSKSRMYGLIAEHVHTEFPYLCHYNAKNEPESVKYHELSTLLLIEIQRLNERIEKLEGKKSET
jgi:hypothetical protein